MWEYVLIQFAGYLLQMLPPVFLFFAPFGDDAFRIPRKKILLGLCVFLSSASLIASVLLGYIFREGSSFRHGIWIPNLIFSCCLLIGSLAYFLSFRKGQKGRLLFYMLVVQYGITLYAINETVTRFVDVKSWEAYYPYEWMSVLLYAVSTAVTFPPLYRFLRQWNTHWLGRISQKSINLISICSSVMVLLTVIGRQMEIGLYAHLQSRDAKLYMSIWLICFLFGNLFSYFIYFGCLLLEREKEDMQSRLTAYEIQYEHMRGNIDSQKRRNHDLRHHFRTLSVLAQNGQTEKIQEYLNNYLEDLEKVEARQICKNSVINNVLNYYIIQAEDRKISMKYEIQVQENYPFDMMDMTVLLGNAMENALKACEDCGENKSFIRVVIRQYRQTLLFQIENSVLTGESTAAGKEIIKGYGLTNIELVALKYQGCVQAWRENQKFILRVLLNI